MNSKEFPAIRFTGFEGRWEKRRLGDVLQYEQPQPYIVKSTNYDDAFEIPVLTAGQSFILGYTDEKTGIKNASVDDAVIIFDDFMTSSHYVEFPFKVKSSAMKILFLNDSDDNDYFVYYLLKNIRYVPANHERHWISKFSNFEVFMPKKQEQYIIGEFLRNIDNLLRVQETKIEKLKQVCLSMGDRIFARGNAQIPQIRFKGYFDEWKECGLGDIVYPYTDYLPTPVDGYTRLGIRSHMKGTFYEYVAPTKRLGEKRLQRVKKDNLIVNIVFAWEHAIAITTEDDEGKLVSHRFPQFSFKEGMYPRFFHYALSDERFRHHLWLASPSGAGRNKTLRIDEMLEYKLRIPCYEEQKQIADFMDSLENLIDLYGQKLEQLQHIKSALLEKMFVS